jgi:hypothetical protein
MVSGVCTYSSLCTRVVDALYRGVVTIRASRYYARCPSHISLTSLDQLRCRQFLRPDLFHSVRSSTSDSQHSEGIHHAAIVALLPGHRADRPCNNMVAPTDSCKKCIDMNKQQEYSQFLERTVHTGIPTRETTIAGQQTQYSFLTLSHSQSESPRPLLPFHS